MRMRMSRMRDSHGGREPEDWDTDFAENTDKTYEVIGAIGDWKSQRLNAGVKESGSACARTGRKATRMFGLGHGFRGEHG